MRTRASFPPPPPTGQYVKSSVAVGRLSCFDQSVCSLPHDDRNCPGFTAERGIVGLVKETLSHPCAVRTFVRFGPLLPTLARLSHERGPGPALAAWQALGRARGRLHETPSPLCARVFLCAFVIEFKSTTDNNDIDTLRLRENKKCRRRTGRASQPLPHIACAIPRVPSLC